MSRNGQIIQPNAMNVETTFADGPLAQPAVVTLAQPGQVKILTIGGLTKVEALAGNIVGSLCQPGILSQLPTEDDDFTRLPNGETLLDIRFEQHVARRAVSLAEAILAESRRRAQPQPEPQ